MRRSMKLPSNSIKAPTISCTFCFCPLHGRIRSPTNERFPIPIPELPAVCSTDLTWTWPVPITCPPGVVAPILSWTQSDPMHVEAKRSTTAASRHSFQLPVQVHRSVKVPIDPGESPRHTDWPRGGASVAEHENHPRARGSEAVLSPPRGPGVAPRAGVGLVRHVTPAWRFGGTRGGLAFPEHRRNGNRFRSHWPRVWRGSEDIA